ncbi:MAG: PilZ domain-containing protein [Candidatus Omnitrophota bacterium]
MVERKERRKYPRVKDKNISIKLSGEGFDTITQSLDVSASGIYCKVKKHIPLMSRVQIVLTLPVKGDPSNPTSLDVDGIVVREHPVIENGRVHHYDLAIFFDSLLPRHRKKLVQYINQRSKS